jgi:flagellar basal-body rod protein FlgF
MENTLLVSLSRQMALRHELDVVANNVANINTTGFKRDNVLFNEYMMPNARAEEADALKPVSYVVDRATMTNFSTGSVETTGAEFDLAIQGEGFFAVQTPQGERYTRAGSFGLNAQGELVTPAGHKVMGTGGTITFTPQDGKVTVGADGTIYTSQGQRGKVRLVTLKPAQLKKEGETLFSSSAAAANDTQSRLVQGAIEKSNVKPVAEISRMIEINRAYTTISQMIERTASLRQTAIERLAQVS